MASPPFKVRTNGTFVIVEAIVAQASDGRVRGRVRGRGAALGQAIVA